MLLFHLWVLLLVPVVRKRVVRITITPIRIRNQEKREENQIYFRKKCGKIKGGGTEFHVKKQSIVEIFSLSFAPAPQILKESFPTD